MPRWLRDNSLSIVLFGLFAIFLMGQSLTGWRTYNAQQEEHREPTVGFGTYLTTGHFVEATFENWESEFLQMASYVLLTIWLIQKGSSESKPPGGDPEKDADPRSVPDLGRAPVLCGVEDGSSRSTRTLWGSLSRSSSCCRSCCTRWEAREEFSAARGSRAATSRHDGVHDDIHLLVPVVSELRRGSWPSGVSWCSRSSCDNGAPRIETCRCPSRRHWRLRKLHVAASGGEVS